MWHPFRRSSGREALSFTEKLRRILLSIVIAGAGIVILKIIPMMVWGVGIEFDASLHVTTTIISLYVIWFFIDQNPRWRVPFFMVATGVVLIVAIQRLLVDAHSDIGVLLAIVLGLGAVMTAEWHDIRDKISF